jgi:hypothetical protein
MRSVLSLAVIVASAFVLTACGGRHDQSADNHANTTKQDASAPVTDATAAGSANPVGAPVRPLADLPSIQLAPQSGTGEPGIAFFVRSGKGTGVRIATRAVQPGVKLSADLARGGCGAGARTAYQLQPVRGNDSTTVLAALSYENVQTSGLAVRVLENGKVIQCGVIGSKGEGKTRS